MSAEPRFFQLDTRRDFTELERQAADCRPAPGTTVVNGIGGVLDASKNNYPEDTGRWTVAAVY